MSRAIWIHWAPLLNFRATVRSLSLANGLRLRKIQQTERKFLMKQSQLGLTMLIDLSQVTHVVDRRPSTLGEKEVLSAVPFSQVVTALRLLQRGGVGFDYVGSSIAVLAGPRIASQEPSTGMWSGRNPVGRAGPYILDRRLRKAIPAIHDLLVSRIDPALEAAIARFNFAYKRVRPGDSLVDYWIALEGLFSPDDKRELAYRMALRIAYFLEDSPPQRHRTYQLMLDSYDLRSTFVHGGKPKPASKKLKIKADALIEETEGTLRRSLVKLLQAGTALKQEALDDCIALGDTT